MAATGPNLQCRMYESEFPEPDDIVVVLVKEIQEMGGYVHLMEYNNCEGMIMLSELSRRRIRSVNKLLKVGQQEYAAVVRVDTEKGYIDLSKRRVAKEDVDRIAEKWNKSRTVHSIVRHVAETIGVDMQELYERWGWPLYRKYGHAYDGLRMAVNDPDTVLEGLDIREREREELMRNVSRRLTPHPIKLRADIEVTCFHFEGIDAVRHALAAGEATSFEGSANGNGHDNHGDANGNAATGNGEVALSSENPVVKIKLVAPPLYVVTTAALQKQRGIDALNRALETVEREIVAKKGKYVCKVEPRTVSDKDEKQLSAMMSELESKNRETAGDDDSSASDSD